MPKNSNVIIILEEGTITYKCLISVVTEDYQINITKRFSIVMSKFDKLFYAI